MPLTDLRLAARLLARDRAFTVTAVLALACGIAASTTVFTLLNGIFLRDLPFADPDRIVGISTRNVENAERPFDNLSFPDLQDLRDSARTFDGMAAVDEGPMSVTDGERPPERIIGAYISAEGFSLLGRRPLSGRDFTADDDRRGADAVVILGHDLWQRWYGGDPGILGRAIRVNGVASTVIGVMPAGFGFPQGSSLWQPLAVRPWSGLEDRGARNVDGFGRMKPGVTIEHAAADLDLIMGRLAEQFPATNAGVMARVRAFRDLSTGSHMRLVAAALSVAVVFLLLIACANVANLLLSRGALRAREMSVRLSLGASRGRIVRQLLVESLLLAAVAGVAGSAMGVGGVRVVDRLLANMGPPYWVEFPIDGTVLAFFVLVSAATAALSGIVPALHASGTAIAGVLSEAGRSAAGSLRHRRWADAFVVTQLALTLVLLTGAGLMIRNGMALSRVDAGIDVSGLLAARLDLSGPAYATADARRAFYDRLEERLAATPGLRAGLGAWAPLGGAYSRAVLIEGRPEPAAGERPRASNVMVGPTYFGAIRVAPLRGRLFGPGDGSPVSPVAVVNLRFAERHFPDRDPIGQRLALDAAGSDMARTPWLTIVGIVPNVRHEEADPREIEPVVYTPLASQPLSSATIVAASGPGVTAVVNTLRGIVAAIDPDLPIFGVRGLEGGMSGEAGPRVFSTMFGTVAGVALALAAIGVYGVIAYAATQRTREIGVRIALGARSRDVWWLVARRAVLHLGIGLALGTAGALAAGQMLQSVLFGVSGRDPVTLISVVTLIVIVTLGACVGPTRRATRIDPVAALRAE